MRTVRSFVAVVLAVLVFAPTLLATAPRADAQAGTNTLGSGEFLYPGQQLVASNGTSVLSMQGDGNLVLIASGNRPIWASNTSGNSGSVLLVQGDGNLVLIAPGNHPIWASNTSGNSGSVLRLQDDGNLVLIAPGNHPIWATNTRLPADPATPAQPPTTTIPPPTTDGSTRVLAGQIFQDRRITLATRHVSGVRDQATAKQQIIDTMNGRAAERSSYRTAPGGKVNIARAPLAALAAIPGRTGHRIDVSEIAGGEHKVGSRHYSGLAIDINKINGEQAKGKPAAAVVAVCRSFGASSAFLENNNHVHCEWRVGTR